MKNIFLFFLLTLFITGQLQIGSIYAQSETQLEQVRNRSLEKLESLDTLVASTLEKIEGKTRDKELQQQIKEKKQEIETFITEVQVSLQESDNKKDIEEELIEARKTLMLKVVSGVTPLDDISENIPQELQKNSQKSQEAQKLLQESMTGQEESITLMIRSKLSPDATKELFHTFDTTIILDFLYEDSGKNYFELEVQNESLFRQEMLPDIESGKVPEKFLSVEFLLPELYLIGEDDMFAGENIETTWGVSQYKTFTFFGNNTSTQSVKVGVVDTGVDAGHPDLSANTSGGYDFVNDDNNPADDQGHGTHVAGTIAAQINATGIIGVNPNAKIVPLKICTSSGFCPSYAVLKSLEYAKDHKLDILNMSLGGKANPIGHPVCAGISAFTDAGGIVIAASGNSNIDTSNFVPGGCNDALTVAAVDSNGKRAVFSNFGPKVDVAAPGVDIYSTYPQNKGSYKKLSGTSMAAPHIVGLISLLKAKNPNLTSSQAKEILKRYPKTVSTDAGKYIAQAVDVPKLLSELNTQTPKVIVQEVLQVPVIVAEKKSSETQSGTLQNVQDEAQLDISGVIPQSTQRVIQQKKTFDISTNTSSLTQILPLAHIQDITEIQNENSGYYETQNVVAKLEVQKPKTIEKSIKSFDTFGKEIQGHIEINANEELTQIFGIPNFSSESFSLNNYAINDSVGETQLQNKKTHEVFLFGAEKNLQINSTQEKGEDIDFPIGEATSLFTGTLLETKVEFIIPNSHQEEVILENIQINNFEDSPPGESIVIGGFIEQFSENALKGPTPLELPQNIIFSGSGKILFENEIFIDGAEKSIEINSFGNEVPNQPILIPSEIFNPDAAYNVLLDPNTLFVPIAYIPKDLEEIPEYIPTEVINVGAIETPENIEFSDTELQDGEIVPGIIDTHRDISTVESIGIQNTYSCEVIYGGSCTFDISRAWDYNFTPSNNGIASVSASKREVTFKSTGIGESVFQVTRNGINYHTIYITVKEPQVQETFSYTVQKGQYTFFNLPINPNYSYFQIGGGAYLGFERARAGQQPFYIRGNHLGKSSFFLTDFKTGKALYKINVEVIPVPPEIVNIDMYIGTIASKGAESGHMYTCSGNNQYVKAIGVYNRGLQFTALNEGNTQIKCSISGEEKYIFNITVQPLPVVQEYTVNVVEGNWVNFYFPQKGNNIGYAQEVGATGYAPIYNFDGYVAIHGHSIGQVIYRILDKSGVTHYRVTIQVSKAPPVVVDTNYFVDQSFTYSLKNAFRYSYSSSAGDIASLQLTSNTLFIKGLKPGSTQITASDGGGLRYVFNITVNPPPEPQRISVQTQELKTTKLSFPIPIWYFNEQQGSSGKATSLFTNNTLIITGQVSGTITYNVRDGSNLLRYIVDVVIIPEPPIVQEISVFETRSLQVGNIDFSNNFTFSKPDIISLSRNGYTVSILGLSGGYVEVYQKDNNGRHTHTYKVSVISKPIPEIQTLKVHTQDSIELYFPTHLSYASIFSSGENIMNKIEKYPNFYRLDLNKSGTYILSFRDKNNFDIAQIIVESSPSRTKFQVAKGYKQKVGSSYSNYMAQSNNPDITTFYRDDTGYILGNKVGTSEIHMYRDGQVRVIFEVEVVPTPDPTTIDCTILIGETCHLDTYFGSLQLVTDTPKYIKMEYGSHTIRVKGEALGSATVFVKGRYSGNNLTHILKIHVVAKPAEVVSCTIPAGAECQTQWYDDADTYSITTTNQNILHISLYRYFQNFVNGNRKLEKTIIKGLSPGYAEVYLYRYGVHIATIQTTVTASVDTLQLSEGNLTLKEGETQILNIISGGGGYQVQNGDESIANLRISSSSNTGTLKVSGLKYGQERYIIRDQYFQTVRLDISVEDTILELSHEELLLNSSNSEYVYARESYQGIKNFTKSNENIRVIKKLLENGQEVLEVFPEKTGETILTVYDNQGNVDSVIVKVGGSTNTGTQMGSGGAKFESYFIMNNPEETTLKNILAFNIIGDYNEIGIEFKDENNQFVRQIVEKNIDGFYIVQLDESICSICGNSFTPYITDSSGNTVYPNLTEKYLAFSEEAFRDITINSGIALASSEDETIKINYIPTIKYYWKNREDLGTKYVLDFAWVFGEMKGLPISSYMLKKFMYGDGSAESYGNNHWITQELLKTTWYSEKLELAKNQDLDNLTKNSSKTIFKCDNNIPASWKIQDTDNYTRQRDFFYSFGNICPYIKIEKDASDITYFTIIISDLYDFKATFDQGFKVDALNAWASYYQEKNLGKIFNWDIKYKIKL